jgi:RNA-directed DNA polymerase
MLSAEEFEQYWNEWSARELVNYKESFRNNTPKKKYLKKGYTHFDLRFWFPERHGEIKQILLDKLKYFNRTHKRMDNWAFAPFLKILIKTPRYKFQEEEEKYDLETKTRPISFSSHIDSLIFGFYAYVLGRMYEQYIVANEFDECVLAYRTDLGGKCNIQFSKEVFDQIKKKGPCTAIALDIKGYFDHIDHATLKEKWEKIISGKLPPDKKKLPPDQYKIYKALTAYSYISKNRILKRYNIRLDKLSKKPKTLLDLVPEKKDFEKFDLLRSDKLVVKNKAIHVKTKKPIGIPQGSAMSALLSNIYLLDFDRDLYNKSKAEGFIYRRYCDDILIICDSENAVKLQEFVIDKIDQEYFLEIQSKKTVIVEFRQNSKGVIRGFNKKKLLAAHVTTDKTNEGSFYKSLQYLGFEFNGQDIFIRGSSLSRYYRKMKGRIAKTVAMAYSDNAKGSKIWKEQLFHRYTHLGKRNFLSYAYNASKATYKNSQGQSKPGMDSPAIRKQLAKHFYLLIRSLQIRNERQFALKNAAGDEPIFKQ